MPKIVLTQLVLIYVHKLKYNWSYLMWSLWDWDKLITVTDWLIRISKQSTHIKYSYLWFGLGVSRSNFRRSKHKIESFQFHKIESFNNFCQILAQDRKFYNFWHKIESSNNGIFVFLKLLILCQNQYLQLWTQDWKS